MKWKTAKHRRFLALRLLILLFSVATLTSCGVGSGIRIGSDTSGGGGGGPAGGNGTVVLLLRDAPADNVLALRASITGINLVSATNIVTLVTSPLDQEFRGQLLRNTVLAQASVTPGTYTSFQITLASPSVTFFNPADATFVSTVPDFPTATATVSLTMSVTAGSVTPVLLELDLARSVTFTQPAQGTQLQPHFTPAFTARVIDLATDTSNLARVDDLTGTVSNINATNNSFTFTTLGANLGLAVTVSAATLFNNVSGLATLANGSVVDLDARLQSSGSFLADEVEFRGTSSLIALRGPVVGILARDATNNVTRFNLVVREATQTVTGADIGQVVTIRLTPGQTTFRLDGLDLPVGTFTFDPQSILVGQAVAVELASTDSTNGFPASSITLKQEAMAGTVGPDIGQTSFSFVPGSDFLQSLLLLPRGLNRMTVSTSIATQFENLPAGLGSMTPNSSVTVRGLLFSQFDQPKLVAKRVRAPSP